MMLNESEEMDFNSFCFCAISCCFSLKKTKTFNAQIFHFCDCFHSGETNQFMEETGGGSGH